MTVLAFTRPERRLPESIAIAEKMGFTVMAAPSLEITPCELCEVERVLGTINKDDIVVFTSPTSAEECGKAPRFRHCLKEAHIISIGPGTASALEHLGVRTEMMPSEYSSKGIVEFLDGSVAGKKVFLIRSDHGSRVLDRGLREMGADVIDFISYTLMPADPKQLDAILDAGSIGKVDVFALTSPLGAKSFVEAAEGRGIDAKDMFGKAKVAAIGRPTTDMLVSLDIRVDIVPEHATFEDMLLAIKNDL